MADHTAIAPELAALPATTEDFAAWVSAQPLSVLSAQQRSDYFRDGYLLLPAFVQGEWLARLQALSAEYVERSAAQTASNSVFDLEPSHTADQPRLRRLNSPVEVDDGFWEFASIGPIVDIAQDLLGRNVKFHHSKLNYKWSGGGEEVKWHQDIQFWPHTNYDVLTIGVYLEDVTPEMAPMGVIPGSHNQRLHHLYENGRWTGHIADEDLADVAVDQAHYLQGPAGSVTVHHCRMVHGSAVNRSGAVRPLLLNAYSAGDAIPVTRLTDRASRSETIVRGEPAQIVRFDPRPCPMPPDWSRTGGYKSIFAHQQAKD